MSCIVNRIQNDGYRGNLQYGWVICMTFSYQFPKNLENKLCWKVEIISESKYFTVFQSFSNIRFCPVCQSINKKAQ